MGYFPSATCAATRSRMKSEGTTGSGAGVLAFKLLICGCRLPKGPGDGKRTAHPLQPERSRRKTRNFRGAPINRQGNGLHQFERRSRGDESVMGFDFSARIEIGRISSHGIGKSLTLTCYRCLDTVHRRAVPTIFSKGSLWNSGLTLPPLFLLFRRLWWCRVSCKFWPSRCHLWLLGFCCAPVVLCRRLSASVRRRLCLAGLNTV